MEEDSAMGQSRGHKQERIIQSVQRAIDILELFTEQRRAIDLTGMSQLLGLSKSTVYGIARTLVANGYLEYDQRYRRFSLGLKLLVRSSTLLRTLDLAQVALPHMQACRDLCQESVYLAVLRDGEVVYLQRTEGAATLGMRSEVGTRLPAHCTALGKVLLAQLSDDELNEVVTRKGLPKLTENTITDPVALRRHLEEVRLRGYATDMEERQAGGQCVAAPIRDSSGQVVAAVSISVPSVRMNEGRRKQFSEDVQVMAHRISAALAYRSE
jgi:IclR family KDG regulon transcriptional repressor